MTPFANGSRDNEEEMGTFQVNVLHRGQPLRLAFSFASTAAAVHADRCDAVSEPLRRDDDHLSPSALHDLPAPIEPAQSQTPAPHCAKTARPRASATGGTRTGGMIVPLSTAVDAPAASPAAPPATTLTARERPSRMRVRGFVFTI
jgi:hypothetical protein